MIKKSDNMTSILTLIIGLAALTVAIVALVNNKKDYYTADDSTCCMLKGQTCKDEKSGWCIGTNTDNNLTFYFQGNEISTFDNSLPDNIVKYSDTLNVTNSSGGMLGSTSGSNACPRYATGINDDLDGACNPKAGLGNNYIKGVSPHTSNGWFTTWDLGMRSSSPSGQAGATIGSHDITLIKTPK